MRAAIVLASMPGGDGRTLFVGHASYDADKGTAPEFCSFGISRDNTPLTPDQQWSCFDRVAAAVAENLTDDN